MYTIKTTGQAVKSFVEAIKIAGAANSEVIEVATGLTRWSPLPPVSAKRMRQYREGKNARAAYEKSL
jgi:hypothetical protein